MTRRTGAGGARYVMGLATLILASGCAYYNTMWSAEQHAAEARRLEQRGQVSEARAEWTQAANKAEIVTLRHPRSRWVDDALVLQAEALARSGACQDAVVPLARARASVHAVGLRERVDLAAADCAIAAGNPVEAEAALSAPLLSGDADRRSRAEYLAARAATVRRDFAAAVDHFIRSREPSAPGLALVAKQRLLITQARTPDDLRPLISERGTDDLAHLGDLATMLITGAESPAGQFHLAEIARDSLQAPLLAAEMFLAAARDSASLYAPKALIAALWLLPDRRDSIVAVLDSRYAASPYTRAFHGESSIAYAAAEDSLAKAFGVAAARSASAPAGARFAAPRPGPRGPVL